MYMLEKIVETKSCTQCSCQFDITDKDLEFYEIISPVFNWKKYKIPSPNECSNCREQNRLAWRNERNLYHRKCDITWENIISIYSPDKPYPVYELDEWKSDRYDPFEYWRNYDFSKTFFEQLWELINETPKQSLFRSSSCVDSPYINYCSWMNKCHLIFDSMESEDCIYGTKVSYCKNCLDCDYTIKSELCYSCNDCSNCYGLKYSSYSNDCRESEFLNDCIWCMNCFMCKWLRNKSYHIFNKEYSKEEYQEEVGKIKAKSIQELEEIFEKFCLDIPSRSCFINNSEDSSWNNLNNCSSAQHCFDAFDIQDCKYCSRIFWSKDCYDYESWWHNTSKIYNCIWTGSHSSEVLFSVCTMSKTLRVMYSILSTGCSDCFGCVNMKDNQYCILNKQYTKEEYEELVPKIIEKMIDDWEWWAFFPSNLSLFWYNETDAQKYFPLSKEEVSKKWYNWSDYEAPFPKVEKTIQAKDLPADITHIPDDILNWAIICEVSWKPFKLVPQELEFYRKHNISIPKRHPDQRHLDRTELRNPRSLFNWNCDKCWVDIKSVYSEDRKEMVYCQSCYNKEKY